MHALTSIGDLQPIARFREINRTSRAQAVLHSHGRLLHVYIARDAFTRAIMTRVHRIYLAIPFLASISVDFLGAKDREREREIEEERVGGGGGRIRTGWVFTVPVS